MKALLIGGNGILGNSIYNVLSSKGIFTTSIDDREIHNRDQIVFDLNSDLGNLNLNENYDIAVSIFDGDIGYQRKLKQVLRDRVRKIVIISTTLVYNRSSKNTGPIEESHPVASKGVYGGYVDKKLDLEEFWINQDDIPYIILRPYHILGPGAYLGCLPFHNRDPLLLKRITDGQDLRLYNAGEVMSSFVNSKDIGEIVRRLASSDIKNEIYNISHPTPFKVVDYYKIIGGILSKEINIQSISKEKVMVNDYGWEMTIFPHVYEMSKIKKDLGYTPQHSLKDSIREVIDNYPNEVSTDNIPVHKNMNLPPRPHLPEWL